MPNNKPRHIKLGKRSFLLLDRLGTHQERYKARDLDASPGGSWRAVHVLPRSKEMSQHIRVLERKSQTNHTMPTILGYHPVRDKIYLVLPWIKGPTLADYMARCRRPKQNGLSTFEAVGLFNGLAHGLTQLHSYANIVHGDLKPQNIIVCREPNRLVLIDFGSAWLVERTMTRSDGDGIDRHYSAPELLGADGTPDFRSDQFSASMIWYEMLTLERPYSKIGGRAGLEGNERFRTLIPPSVKSRDKDRYPGRVWAKIDNVVTKGLQLDPNKRYPNRSEWLDGLGEIKSAMKTSTQLGTVNRAILDFLDTVSRKVFRRS